MEKNDTFKIHVTVGNWRFPLTIARKDEELYRKAEKNLAAQFNKYSRNFPKKTDEEKMAIVAYHLAVELEKQAFMVDSSPLSDKIKELSQEIDSAFSSEE